MHDIVMICSIQDKFIAEALCRHMEESGLKCLCCHRDFTFSVNRSSVFPDVLSAASAVVFLYSASANHSEEVMSALQAALHSGHTVVPLRLDHSVPDKRLSDCLQPAQWLDATNGSLEENSQALSSYIRMLLPNANTPRDAVHIHAQPNSGHKKWLIIVILIILIAAGMLLFRNHHDDVQQETSAPQYLTIPSNDNTLSDEADTPSEEPAMPTFEIEHLGGTYIGTLKDGIPHGEGILELNEGTYTGNFADGYPYGHGEFKFYNGATVSGDNWDYGTVELDTLLGSYSGMLLDSEANGYGTVDFKYGAIYQGTLMKNLPFGLGTYTYYDCCIVSGEWDWIENVYCTWLPDRQGADMYYTGMVCNGVYSGQGFLSFRSGGAFMGEFKCNNPDGWGVYSYRSPRSDSEKLLQGNEWITVFEDNRLSHSYYGLKLQGKWQGFGIGIKDSGYAYCGEIRNDYRDGHGELYTAKDVLERWGIYRDGTIRETYKLP